MIDWNKPVRFKEYKDPVKVIATFKGQAYITWGTEARAESCDENGKVIGYNDDVVENVPPPKVYLVWFEYRMDINYSWEVRVYEYSTREDAQLFVDSRDGDVYYRRMHITEEDQ